jgi:hypothetical protein
MLYRLTSFCLKLLLLLSFASVHSLVSAETVPSNNQRLIASANTLSLHESAYWKALLHYTSRPLVEEGEEYLSEIKSEEFFLSKSGRSNAKAELNATINALLAPVVDDVQKHARCIFPARYLWLKKHLPSLNSPVDIKQCENYQTWSLGGNVDSISLVFANGYFKNPASYYGHILLKFNSDDETKQSSDFLAKSMDYGAILNNQDNAVAYIFKGIFGFYDAGFTHAHFYEKNHNYGEDELRDLWDYQLALEPDEVEMIVAHGWEVLGAKFQYFFTKKNCATAMADLIELVVDKQLYPRNQPWVAPVSVFMAIAETTHNGKSLVEKISRIASRESRLKERYAQLDANEKTALDKIMAHEKFIEILDQIKLSTESKQRILETLLDYYQFLLVETPTDKELKNKRKQVLLYSLALPVKKWEWKVNKKIPPHNGQKHTMLRVSAYEDELSQHRQSVRLRPAYFDFLNLKSGRAPYTLLSMLDTTLVHRDGSYAVEKVDLLNIETMNVSETGLEGEGGNAWKLRVGYEQYNDDCLNCGVYFFEAGYGKAKQLSDSILVYGLLDGRLQSNHLDSGLFSVSPRVGFIADLSDFWSSSISIQRRFDLDGSATTKNRIQWQNRLGYSSDWDIRIGVAKENKVEYELSYSHYW